MYAVKTAVFMAIFNLAVYAGGIIPFNGSDSDIYYNFHRELYLRGQIETISSIYSPSVDGVSDDIGSGYRYLLTPLHNLESRYLAENNNLALDINLMPHSVITNEDENAYMALAPYLNYGFSDRLTMAVAYRVDGALVDDHRYQGKKWDNFAGYADLAVISYRTQKLRLDIGRRQSCWGAASGGNSLMLSSSAMPMDGVFFDYFFGKHLSFHSITAYLSPLPQNSPYSDIGQTDNRYFSAHALRISPLSWWEIVLKESVIYGGIGRRLEPGYIIPAIWYHAEQLNDKVDDNTFFGFETIIRSPNRYAAFLEILLDDIQIENETEADNEPTEIGIIIGADLFDWPIAKGALEFQYTRVNNYTYNQIKPRNVYINQNYPIGHPLGPDHESYEISYTYHATKEFTAILKGSLTNNGEGALGDPWTEPWLDNPEYSEKFPSGIVERRLEGKISIHYVKNDWLRGKLSADLADIKNNENYSAVNETDWGINIQIMVHLPKLSWRFSDD